MKIRSKNNMPAFFSAAAFFLALALLATDYVETLSWKEGDFFFRLRHRFVSPAPFSAPIVFVGIDDKSLDPSYSANAYPWGRGGWQTRHFYTLQMQWCLDIFQPRVLAYDLLLRPIPESAQHNRHIDQLAEALHRNQIQENMMRLLEVEQSGNRTLQAQLYNYADALAAGRAAPRVIFAVDFPESNRALERTSETARAAAETWLKTHSFPEGVVEGELPTVPYPLVNLPPAEILDSPMHLAGINVPRDRDGVIRRVPMIYAFQKPGSKEIRYVPGLALESLLLYWGIDVASLLPWGRGTPAIVIRPGEEILVDTGKEQRRIPIDENGAFLLNTRYLYSEFPNCSFVDVVDYGPVALGDERMRAQVPENVRVRFEEIRRQMNGKIAVIGEAATAAGDLGNYPMETYRPNALAHLTVLDNVLREDYVRPVGWRGQALVALWVCLAACLLYVWLPVFAASLGMAGAAIFYPVVAAGAFLFINLQLPLLIPLLLLLLLFGANAYYFYGLEARQRAQVRKMFSTVVSDRILQFMEEDANRFRLTGQKAEATMFFSDVAGFTSISEKLAPEELSALLNRYLTPMTDIILQYDGYLDKYSGDGIMAVWGVPYPMADHAVKACQAAWRQQERVQALGRDIENETGVRIEVRMGLNSGTVSAGNMGSEKKFQYTVMGDAVNLAARLEPANKEYGTGILLGEETRRLAGDAVLTRLVDRLVVKGKTQPVAIYELLGLAGENRRPEWAACYEQALEDYWQRRWDAAIRGFEECRSQRGGDAASARMLERIEFFRADAPPADWNGAWIRKEKD
jgi:class 3 adenylate cyclase/CHASE2 domain-containing sensor protein